MSRDCARLIARSARLCNASQKNWKNAWLTTVGVCSLEATSTTDTKQNVSIQMNQERCQTKISLVEVSADGRKSSTVAGHLDEREQFEGRRQSRGAFVARSYSDPLAGATDATDDIR